MKTAATGVSSGCEDGVDQSFGCWVDTSHVERWRVSEYNSNIRVMDACDLHVLLLREEEAILLLGSMW